MMRAPSPITDKELEDPKVGTVLRLIWESAHRLVRDPVGQLLGSTFLLIMLWGSHGTVELLRLVWGDAWAPGGDRSGQPTLIPNLPWDQEWLSFLIGAALLVGIPALIITRGWKQRLADYGLCLPPRDRRAFAWRAAAILFLASLPAFYLAVRDPGMRATYPLYRGAFAGWNPFLVYEIGYFVFFLVIEFTFRGLLLFGLYGFKDQDALPGVLGERGPLVFGSYAIFISMLSYTAWHLGKPVPELWGTLVWGVAAGTVVLFSRSIVPVTVVHWLLNVLLDLALWRGW